MVGAAGLSGLLFMCRRVMEKGTGLFWPPKPPHSTCQALVQTTGCFAAWPHCPRDAKGSQDSRLAS